ncbi:hypothetical protein [Desulfosporosinus sp.]|uniref:hypothetical protein n=1 Tax=Desulfosporosinus sp. TaxID=157907 RepID=UPI000E9BDE40|nr:hypothetical protein [Desulfosporosinus sp.]MBC2721314.1 hypothetical protein [Desulfosporosinus sp.]MBC2728746.1 hypothetical protein [Desulfosporosinus sp.]HBV87688.1 hypothetical protein [Desulfosporosinus sp.]
MGGKLKIEITGEKNVLEIFETEPGKIAFVMYPDDPQDDTWLEVIVDTSEFSSLFKRLIDEDKQVVTKEL